MPLKSKILLVDDYPVVRCGLAAWVNGQPDLAVCGEVSSATEAWRQIELCQPDLVVVGLLLEDGSGLDFLQRLKKRRRGPPAIVFSLQDEWLYAPRALHAGAKGYVSKREPGETLVGAIRHVLRGHIFLSESMRMRLVDRLGGSAEPAFSPLELLSNRELDVFRLLGKGMPTRDIAQEMHLSVKTVETYYDRIKVRLSLRSVREVVRCSALWAERADGDERA